MDIVDISSPYETSLREDALAKQRTRHLEAMSSPSLADCEDCGEPIPEARRKAQKGCKRCVPCQSIHERTST